MKIADFYRWRDQEKALRHYKSALSIGYSYQGYRNLGEILLKQGMYDEAATTYLEAIEKLSSGLQSGYGNDQASFYSLLAHSYSQAGKEEESLATLLKAVETPDPPAYLWATLAEEYLKRNDDSSARAALDKMIQPREKEE